MIPSASISFSEARFPDDRYRTLCRIFRGNMAAIELMQMFRHVAHIWDDLIDRDRKVNDADINGAFWAALVGIPSNSFFNAHRAVLLPSFAQGIMGWLASNELALDKKNPLSREIAHIARSDAGDFALLIAQIIGGPAWAAMHAATLKILMRNMDYAEFIADLDRSDK